MSFLVAYDVKVEKDNDEKYENLYAALRKLDAKSRQESVWEIASESTRTAQGLCLLLSAGLDPDRDKLVVVKAVDWACFPQKPTVF